MRINSYLTAWVGLVLFVTTLAVIGLFGSPSAPTPVLPPAQVTQAIIAVTPECTQASTVDLRQSGVSTSAATGVCTLTIDRVKHPFVAVRAESASIYDRTSPENSSDELVVRVNGSLTVWVNTLPSPAYSTWQCGFDVAPVGVSDDTCNGQPLPVEVS